MSLSRRLISRLDIKGRKLIKGRRFDGLRVIGDACQAAKKYAELGVDEIFYTDSVASLYGRNSLEEIVKETSKEVFVPITVGGAIRNIDDGRKMLASGADKLAINSAALLRPEVINELSNVFGKQCVVLSIQARRNNYGGWDLMYESGRERSEKDFREWICECQDRGIGEIFITSVDNDGTGLGPDIKLLEYVKNIVEVPLVFGGGIAKKSELVNLNDTFKKLSGISIGWALHYEKLSISEVKDTISHENMIDNKVFKEDLKTRIFECPKVAVINYSMGNVQSLVNGLQKVGAEVILTDKPDFYDEYNIWALPGVGAFPEGMRQLNKRNLVQKIKNHVGSGGGLIGICLGMQMFFEKSHEYDTTEGLALLNGEVKKMNIRLENNQKLILPHIGWNDLEEGSITTNWIKDFVGIKQYFVHSFSVEPNLLKSDYEFLKTSYGKNTFISGVKKGRIFGLQFHPERSGSNGLKLLRKIIDNL